MNWHDPELYIFLGLLAGLAALLAITYEIFRRRRKPPAIPMKVMPPEPASMPDSRQTGKQEAEQFSRLCESTEDLPPKELAKRERDHFGIFGGVRPVSRRR
jgi:hypothetical protein